jgi:hypothetical protein
MAKQVIEKNPFIRKPQSVVQIYFFNAVCVQFKNCHLHGGPILATARLAWSLIWKGKIIYG